MRILVIDDDPNITDVIQLTFELGWPEVQLIKAETGEKGIGLVESKSPHAVILDLSLPDITGFEVLKQIRLFSEVPVLMLTVNGEEPNVVKALTWGANDYLTKPFRQMEFLARVKSMTRDINVTERDMTISSGAWHFGRSLTELYHGQSLFNLTPVEGLIMHTLIKRAEQYVGGDMLRLKVWGESRTATADNLRVHIHHLRSKLGDDHCNPGIITSKAGRGYMFKGAKPNTPLTTGIGGADPKSESTMPSTKHLIPRTAKIDKR